MRRCRCVHVINNHINVSQSTNVFTQSVTVFFPLSSKTKQQQGMMGVGVFTVTNLAAMTQQKCITTKFLCFAFNFCSNVPVKVKQEATELNTEEN